MKHLISLLVLIASSHAFAGEALSARELEAQTRAAAENAHLDDLSYSGGGYIKSANQICRFSSAGADAPAALRCYPQVAMSHSGSELMQKLIKCLVIRDCEDREEFEAAKAAQDAIDNAISLEAEAWDALERTQRPRGQYAYSAGGYLRAPGEICLYHKYGHTELICSSTIATDGDEVEAAFTRALTRENDFAKLQREQAREAQLKDGALAYAAKQGKDLSQYVYSPGGRLESKVEKCEYAAFTNFNGEEAELMNCLPK